MISKQQIHFSRLSRVELLFAHQFRHENKTQDVHSVYLSLHWHFRKKQRQTTKKHIEINKKNYCAKTIRLTRRSDKKTAQISFKNWNCFGFGGMCLLHIAAESMGIDVDTGHAVPKTVKLEMHWICYETNRNFLLHWKMIMVDQSQQSFSPLFSPLDLSLAFLYCISFFCANACSLAVCMCVCECDCGTSGILLLKSKGKL